MGYSVMIGKCQVLEVEFWGLFHGLQRAWNRGVRTLRGEMDSLTAYNWVKSSGQRNIVHSNLAECCRGMMKRSWSVSIHHVHKEGNRVADALEKCSLKLDNREAKECSDPP